MACWLTREKDCTPATEIPRLKQSLEELERDIASLSQNEENKNVVEGLQGKAAKVKREIARLEKLDPNTPIESGSGPAVCGFELFGTTPRTIGAAQNMFYL